MIARFLRHVLVPPAVACAVLIALPTMAGAADPPPPAPMVTSDDYPECTAGAPCEDSGSPETAGTFRFTADPAIEGFRYGFGSMPITFIADTEGVAEVSLVPPSYGDVVLYVRAVTADGTIGAETSYWFRVARPSPAVAAWALETDPSNTDPFSDTRGGHTLTAVGDVALAADARLLGASTAAFDGTGMLATSEPVISSDTSFGLSVWAKLDRLDLDGTVIAFDGRATSAGAIDYAAAAGAWCLTVTGSDDAAAERSRACAPATTEWTHLTGSYDSELGTISLYVNGSLASVEAAPAAMWNAAGPLSVGRGLYGKVADAYVLPRAVDPREIRGSLWDLGPLMRSVPIARWMFDSDCCGTAFDHTFRGHDLALGPNTLLDAFGSGYALRLNGDVATTDAVVRADGPFTLATSVVPDALDGDALVVSQGDSVAIEYRQTVGAWCFIVGDATACADAPADIGYTRIAGVHDPAADEIRLYVDGVLAASADCTSPPWTNGDGFVLGGAPAFDGLVSDTLAYFGVLNDAEIAALEF